MNDADGTLVPFWTLSTDEGPNARIPEFPIAGELTSDHVDGLRSTLAAFVSSPVATLEVYPLPSHRRSRGLPLDATSPLAQELSRLVSTSSRVPAVQQATQSGEILYRMHVPAKAASQFNKGLLRPMASKAVDGGIYGDLVTSGGKHAIAAKSTFVPVETAVAGASGTAVGTVAGTATAGTVLTVAAPLVLMAVAVGASAYADIERQKAIENITDLLEKLHDDRLEAERSELDGCRDAIDKASALLLDRGKVGASLGLDSAVHAISTATQRASNRVTKWTSALEQVLADEHVDVNELESAFPGITSDGGEFRVQLELAALALALKRRVIVLQAVEAMQSDSTSKLESFLRSLRDDQERVRSLESRIHALLQRLASVEVRTPRRLIDKMMTRRQVDALLAASYQLRALAPGHRQSDESDLVIDIEQHKDGRLLVLPAQVG